MRPADYWQKRGEDVAQRQHDMTDAYVDRLRREYDRAIQSIQHDIEIFYGRFASNNEISMADARRMLNAAELKEFKMTLEDFTFAAKNNAGGQWTKILNNVYFKTRISRLEALQVQIRHRVEMLASGQQAAVTGLLGDVYTDTYYRTLFEVQRGLGFGVTFARIDHERLEKVLQTEWAGSNYSKRIWSNRDKLTTELQTKLSQSFIRGDPLDRTARDLADRMQVSFYNAARVVRTESAFISGEATMDGYKASGVVKKYEFLATLDSRTSKPCRSMDSRVFALNEKEVGVNYPPLHPFCRSTVCPYFDDDPAPERIARDGGSVYYVPGNTTYESWRQKYVE